MLERLRGAASASEPRTQNAIYELGFSVMNPVLVLLEVYKHEVYFLCIRVTPMCAFNEINLLILKKKILLKKKWAWLQYMESIYKKCIERQKETRI